MAATRTPRRLPLRRPSLQRFPLRRQRHRQMLAARRLPDGGKAPLTGHLEELRWRIVWSLAALLAGIIVSWSFSGRLFALLDAPLNGQFEVVTLGVTEPFFTTLTICAYAGLVLSCPVLTYHLYQYIAPALPDDKRRAMRPYLAAVPVLFITGVVFGYVLVLGPAVRFLLSIGSGHFDVQIRAQEYYTFVSTTLIALGIAFLYPLVLLGLARLGVLTSQTLRKNRRFALLGIAVLAALLPTADPVSLVIEMLPLLGLYEVSILLVRGQERRARRGAADNSADQPATSTDPAGVA